MPSLPHLSGAQVVRVLLSLGFVVARQRGSHIVLRRERQVALFPTIQRSSSARLRGSLSRPRCRRKSSSTRGVREPMHSSRLPSHQHVLTDRYRAAAA